MYNFLLRHFLLPAKRDTLLEHLLLPHVWWEIKTYQVPEVGTDISWLGGGGVVTNLPRQVSLSFVTSQRAVSPELYTLALSATAGQGSFLWFSFTLDTRIKLWQSELCIIWVLKAVKF